MVRVGVLYYDYILTITSEIQFVWSSPSISPSFVLFVANGYVGILGHIPVFFEYLSDSSEHVSTSPACKLLTH